MSRKVYSFEKSNRNVFNRLNRLGNWLKGYVAKTNESDENKAVFRSRLGIPTLDGLKNKELHIVERFIGTNLHNIAWYSRHIRKEQRKLNWYYAFTLILLLGVPIFIYIATSGASVDSGSNLVDQLLKEQELSTIITVVVSSLLSLHAFVSAWVDQRKIVVEFSKAKVDLKKLYYKLETKFYENATDGSIGFEGQTAGHVLSDEFLHALSDATVLSQRIVDLETNRYYQLRAQPSFDIVNIWKTSAKGAKTALSLFKSSTFDPEKKEQEVLTQQESIKETANEIQAKEDGLEQMSLKIKQSRQKLEKLSLKMDELELQQDKDGNLPAKQADLYQKYEEQFITLDQATDALEEEYERATLALKLLENRLGELQGDY